MSITVNLSYYNQPKECLLRHINLWKSYPKKIRDKFTFFIIDDCSKIPAEELLKSENISDIDIHLYRVDKDLYCNIAGVRNLGATECSTEYLVILDMDTVIDTNLATRMVELAELNKNLPSVFKFNRKVPNNPHHKKHNKIHPAVCLIRRKDYWNIGGCEEDLVGHYGYTDPSFWNRAKGKVRIVSESKECLLYYPDAESDIIRDTTHNGKICLEKTKNNSWSNDYVRFPWHKEF